MRLPLVLILAASVAWVRADETSATPAVIQALPALNIGAGSGAVSLNVRYYFGIPGATGQVVQLGTSLGKINVELRDDVAPATVTNFLSYVNSGAYLHTLIHRSEPGFVFQTGGFTLNGSTVNVVPAKAPVINEFHLSNTRGTLAMAKVGPEFGEDPTDETINSATNQWFINLADNSANLDNQNGGFTVFAQVLGTGMDVADAIEALSVYDVSSTLGSDFQQMPLRAPNLQLSSLVTIDSLPLLPIMGVENTNPAVVAAGLTGTLLSNCQLVLIPKGSGTAAITVRAADTSGHIVESTLIVSTTGLTVGPNQSAVFRVANTVGSTFQWQCLPVGSTIWANIQDSAGYAGTTTSSLTVPANLAVTGNRYRCTVSTIGKSPVFTTAQLLKVLTAAPIVARQGGPATIAGGGAVTGTTYYASGLPTGLTINPSTGVISGTVTAKPGIYVFTTWSQTGLIKSAVLTRTLVVQPFLPVMTGAFEGLLISTGGVPVGKIEILVAAAGGYSGKLTYGNGFVGTLKGVFTLDANTTSATTSIPLSGGAAVALAIDRNGVFTGTLTVPGTPPSVDTLVGGGKVGIYSSSAPAPWKGAYAMVLGDVYNYGILSAPSGAGHVAVTIASTGVMTLKGKLADGTAVTGSLATDAHATYRPFLMPYKRAWSVAAGFWPLSPRDGQPATYHMASGQGQDFYWTKNAGATDKIYPAGFGWLGLDVSIEPWTTPADVSALATKLGLGSGRALTLLVSCSKVTAVVNNVPTVTTVLSNQGDANTYSIPVSVTLAASGSSVILTGTGPSPVRATVNLADGSFIGTMTLAAVGSTPARVVAIEGSFLQLASPVATDTVGQGFFLLPGETTTSPTFGGLITLSVPAVAP